MADAHGSGPCEVKFMWVQVPFPALFIPAAKVSLCRRLFFQDTVAETTYEISLSTDNYTCGKPRVGSPRILYPPSGTGKRVRPRDYVPASLDEGCEA